MGSARVAKHGLTILDGATPLLDELFQCLDGEDQPREIKEERLAKSSLGREYFTWQPKSFMFLVEVKI